jgi:hypothetical protein
MAPPWLVDAVTLQHFGSIERLSVLCQFLQPSDGPRWTDQVWSEILASYHRSEACRNVLACRDLGQPAAVADLLVQVMRIQVELGGGGISGVDHLGEAECIAVAEQLGGGVVTDDNSAYDLIDKRLGSARVRDTIDVLRDLVRTGELDASDAKLLADAIRNNGRHLRRVHPITLTSSYFS